VISPAQLAERSMRTIEAFKGTLTNGADPELAIAVAAREHLGPLGETDALARVVMSLAHDFEEETGARITSDAMAMSRLLEAYLKAVESMRREGHAQLDLPFLAATRQGPCHLSRRLEPGTIQARASAPRPKPRPWWRFW
jgi:molecular chaperone DnaK (HSP70)